MELKNEKKKPLRQKGLLIVVRLTVKSRNEIVLEEN